MLELFCAATDILVGIISVSPNWLVLPDGTSIWNSELADLVGGIYLMCHLILNDNDNNRTTQLKTMITIWKAGNYERQAGNQRSRNN